LKQPVLIIICSFRDVATLDAMEDDADDAGANRITPTMPIIAITATGFENSTNFMIFPEFIMSSSWLSC